MRSVYGVIAGALLLTSVTAASAQSAESGIVVRVDPLSNVVMLDDGRMYRVTSSTALIVDNRPAQLATLRPGQRVLIQSGEIVTIRDGQYVAVTPAPATVVTPSPGTAVVTPSPGTVVAQAPPVVLQTPTVGVRQTIHGRIAEVEKNGEVKIRTEKDTFEVQLNPEAMRHVKKGDNVTLDLTFTPVGAPSASPR